MGRVARSLFITQFEPPSRRMRAGCEGEFLRGLGLPQDVAPVQMYRFSCVLCRRLGSRARAYACVCS